MVYSSMSSRHDPRLIFFLEIQMNVKDYKIALPKPRREDYTEVVVATSSKGTKRDVKFVDEEGYRAAVKVWEHEEDRLFRLFKEDLKEYLGIKNNPKADLLISKAIDNGGCWENVIAWAEDMVDLIL